MAKTRKVHRSAVDGRFISKKKADKKPRESVTETVKPNKRKNKKGK